MCTDRRTHSFMGFTHLVEQEINDTVQSLSERDVNTSWYK